jgi:hypothetical protein
MIDPDLRVRVATLDDLHEIMQLALMACEENGLTAVNPQKLLAAIYPALMQEHGICGVIGTEFGDIEGVVLLSVGTLWYSDAPTLEEKAIFIHPDFRRSRGGRAARLCEFSKKVADHLGIPLTIGVFSSERTASKVKMYTRIMGPPSGAYWIYGAVTGQAGATSH